MNHFRLLTVLFKYRNETGPTITLAINPAQNTPLIANILDPSHAKGTYKTNIRTIEKKEDGYGLFIPLKLEVLSTTSP